MQLDVIRARARAEIERLYDGRCTIYRYVQGKAAGGENIKTREELYSDVSCRLSYDSAPAASDSDTVDTLTQDITLFLPPEADVPAGCYIVVSQAGKTQTYQNSGHPKVYVTHQEIKLDVVKDRV